MELFKLVGEVALNGTDNVKNELDDISDKGEQSENRLVSAFKKIGTAVVTYFAVDKITNFGMEIARVSAEVGAENSAFAQIMGDYAQQAQEKMQQVADATGVMATRLTPYMTSMTAKFKGLGFGINEATTFATEGLLLASDASAFWDMSLDESMSHLNSFINGSYEGGEAIGLFANDTQMAQYAIRTGLIATKAEWANLDEAIKQATRLEYAQAMMEASGAVGQARKEAGQYANQSADLTEKWRQFKAEIGEPILQNIVVPAMQKLSEMVDKLSQGYKDLKVKLEDAKKWFDKNKDTIDDVIGVVEVLTASFIGLKAGMMIQSAVQGFQKAQIAISLLSMEVGSANLAQQALNGTMTIGETIVALLTGKMTLAQLATGLWTKAQTALNVALKANPIGLIVTAIVALIATIVVLWNKCDWFRNGVKALFEWLVTSFGVVVEWLGDAVDSIVEWFGNAVEDISNFFIGLWQTMGEIIEDIANFFVDLWQTIGEIIDGIKNFFIDLWQTITDVFNTIINVIWVAIQFIGQIFNLLIDIILIPWNFIWQNFGEDIMEAVNIVKDWLIDLWNTFATWITDVWTTISEFFIGVWTTISTWLSDTWTTISEFFIGIWTTITEWVNLVWTTISEFLIGIFTEYYNWAVGVAKSIVEWLTGVWTTIVNWAKGVAIAIVEWATGVWETITTWLNNVKTAITEWAVGVWTTITEWFNKTKEGLAGIVTGIKDFIAEKFNKVKENVSETFSKIKKAITEPIENAKKKVGEVVDNIKSMFKFNVSLPKIKLPHFAVTPKGWELGDLLKGKVPKLGIEWYAKAMDKGMILDEPTIFGINSNGIPMGAGEAGSETVVGTNSLMNMINKAVKGNTQQVDNSGIEKKLDKIMELMLKMKIELDDEVVGNFVVKTVEKEVFN